MELNDCRCGSTPRIRNKTEYYGHNVCEEVYWVECKCGIRTIDVSTIYVSYNAFQTTPIKTINREISPINQAIKIWNENR